MKKTSLILVMTTALSLSTVTLADNSTGQGFYAGANLGASDVVMPDVLSLIDWDTSGFGYNIHAGYMFNQYIGAEVGYTKYADATYSASMTGLVTANDNQTYKAYSIDAVVKGVYYFNPQWSIFGKLGMTSLHAELDINSNFSGFGLTDSLTGKTSKTKIVPLAGIGAGYDVNKNFTVNAGFTFVNGGLEEPSNTSLSGLGDYGFLYAGVDYHF